MAAVLGEEHQHVEGNFSLLKKSPLCLSTWKMLLSQNNSPSHGSHCHHHRRQPTATISENPLVQTSS